MKLKLSSFIIAFLSKLSHKTAAGTCGVMKFHVNLHKLTKSMILQLLRMENP